MMMIVTVYNPEEETVTFPLPAAAMGRRDCKIVMTKCFVVNTTSTNQAEIETIFSLVILPRDQLQLQHYFAAGCCC